MKRETERRLAAIENSLDWTAHLDVFDSGYLESCDYPNDEWEELHFDDFNTAVRHRATGEIRGYYFDRRSDAAIERAGGNLEFL